MKVLVACEESQRVCIAFRERGHEAYSCDIIECSDGHPEWHIQADALSIINNGWDLLIAHPPCTYLTVTGNRWFDEEKYGEKAKERKKERKKAADFFMAFINADCPRIAVENPIGWMNTHYRKPDQIIHPWMFSKDDCVTKATCLWLKGLPPLIPTITKKPEIEYKEWYDERAKRWKRQAMWHYTAYSRGNPGDRAKERSKTFLGIANAMAEQWGNI